MHWLDECKNAHQTSLFTHLLNEYCKKYYISLTIHIKRDSNTLIRRVQQKYIRRIPFTNWINLVICTLIKQIVDKLILPV